MAVRLVPTQDLKELRERRRRGVSKDRRNWLGLALHGGHEPIPPTNMENVVVERPLRVAAPLAKGRRRQMSVLARATLSIQPGAPMEKRLHVGTPNPP